MEGVVESIPPSHQMEDISETMPPLPQIGDAPESTPKRNPVLNNPQLDVNIPDDSHPMRQLDIPDDPLHLPLPDPIGQILVNDHTYDILEVISSSQGLVGRGTICYLAWRGDEEYIVKDHWVLGSKVDALNKVKMLQAMKDVHGVPQFIDHWLVEIKPGEVDQMGLYCYKLLNSLQGAIRTHVHLVLKPCTRPLYMFQTKAELLGDIIRIQKTAVEEKGILHRDCSLNNSMIEDDSNGSHGTLIDWEFAMFIAQGQKYARGGTGTMPFMSQVAPVPALRGSRLIIHHYEYDLKSVFYVFIWICIGYKGPLSVKSVLDRRYNWLVHKWSTITFKACNDKKTTFFYHSHTHKFDEQFHPYFKNLVPLAVEWYNLIRNKGPSNAVTFQEVLDLLDKHLAELLKELSPELLFT
ncbi:uncharacterized protein EDB93DRAFT_1250892 [Suillus bovinus]|uniref:uncharacterized protein n=1 Tax=Suillus bovinus TaxID=48563 RepID=UPI001B87E524|nr:uncharacterized protein EDB93DRAFT_1250892 [Suillus bovinus]KAG2146609.1 hypothetical protein EDB93DRAFT_1250892 [Suillus bovinus]